MVAVSEEFGHTTEGAHIVHKIILRCSTGFEAHILTYGAIVQKLLVPSKIGAADPPVDVVLGYDKLSEYEHDQFFIGCVVGPVAGRIGFAKFPVEDTVYHVTANNGDHCLHSGAIGLHRTVWEIVKLEGTSVTLSAVSPADEDGFPGNLRVTLTYTISNDSSLRLDYSATTDKATPISLTNHSYFNLSGHSAGVVDNHFVSLSASEVFEMDDNLLVTGKCVPVTPSHTQLNQGFVRLGERPYFDHIFKLDDPVNISTPVAIVKEPGCGRVLSVFTDQPVAVLYTGFFLEDVKGKGGACYQKHTGLCIECQQYPDALNHKEFKSNLLKPGESYSQTTIYKLSYEA